LEHKTEHCDISGCSIIFITDQPIEYVNDLEPFDELGNKPVVVFYHNEYNQPPSCLNADIVCYGQPQLKALTSALYPWAASHWVREFDLPCAVFPERIAASKMDNKLPSVVWPNDNFHGQKAAVSAGHITRWHPVSNDLWCTVDDVLHEAFKHGVEFVDGDGDVTREEYLQITREHRAALIAFPRHIYNGRRLFETVCCGTVPIIHVQVERFGNEDSNDYNWRQDKFYSHERFLAQLGFRDGENCIMYRNAEQLDYITRFVANEVNVPLLQRMADNAMELVTKRHSYANRARQILTEVQLFRDINKAQKHEDETGIGLPYTRKEIEL
jgi:hypothetical protein